MPAGAAASACLALAPTHRAGKHGVVASRSEATTPTATVDQRTSGAPFRRHGDRTGAAVDKIHRKPKKRLNVATVAGTPRPNKPQESEREPRWFRAVQALRWPSADEPFVNLGMRKR